MTSSDDRCRYHDPMTLPIKILRTTLRGLLLFAIGVMLSLMLNFIQMQRSVLIFPPDVVALMLKGWWIVPICGGAAALVGLLYPCVDSTLGQPCNFKREWSTVMKCVGIFLGISHVFVKVNYTSNLHMAVIVTSLSVIMWWWFDGTRVGLGLGVVTAVLATLVAHILVINGIYRYPESDMFYFRSWIPNIFFSGGVTMGTIGRQLAMYEITVAKSREKFHIE